MTPDVGKTFSFKDWSKLEFPQHNFYVAIGEESFFRDQVFNRLLSYFNTHNEDISIIKLDCSEIEESLIFSKILARDLFSKKKIFLLRNFIKIKKLEFFLNKKINDFIIFDSEKESKSKAYTEFSKKVITIDCSKPKPWLEESDAISKIIGYLKSKGYVITQDTARYLYDQVGYDLYKIISELDKLVIFKSETKLTGKEITQKDIENICVSGIYFNIFDLIERILANKKKSAFDLLDKILKNDNEAGILLINLWYTHFENLLYVKSTSKKDNELSSCIRIPPMVIQKKLIPQSKSVSTSKILESMDYLLSVDYNLRRGSFNIRYYLEKFILDF